MLHNNLHRIKYLIGVLFFFCIGSVYAEKIGVGIYVDINIKGVTLEPVNGEYILISENGKEWILSSEKKENAILELVNRKIQLKVNQKVQGSFTQITAKPKHPSPVILRILPSGNQSLKREYEDDMIIKLSDNKQSMTFVNQVDFEKYIAGVVQSEIYGRPDQPDIFKLQSVISRTWALKNWGKHQNEGYNVCDRVHCQVYKNRCLRPDILQASIQTCGEVVVDENDVLIETPFHSNSGGQTMNSEDLWVQPIPYLRSVVDTFSQTMKMSVWEKKILKKEWLQYYKKNHGLNIGDDSVSTLLLNFKQESRQSKICNVPLRAVRQDFSLRSTFFDVEEESDHVLIKGKGYGHGVGLSQEGAIRMVQLGMTYEQILPFYYTGCKLKKGSCGEIIHAEESTQPHLSPIITPPEMIEPIAIKEEILPPIPNQVKNQVKEKEKTNKKKAIPDKESENPKKIKKPTTQEKDFDFEIIID